MGWFKDDNTVMLHTDVFKLDPQSDKKVSEQEWSFLVHDSPQLTLHILNESKRPKPCGYAYDLYDGNTSHHCKLYHCKLNNPGERNLEFSGEGFYCRYGPPIPRQIHFLECRDSNSTDPNEQIDHSQNINHISHSKRILRIDSAEEKSDFLPLWHTLILVCPKTLEFWWPLQNHEKSVKVVTSNQFCKREQTFKDAAFYNSGRSLAVAVDNPAVICYDIKYEMHQPLEPTSGQENAPVIEQNENSVKNIITTETHGFSAEEKPEAICAIVDNYYTYLFILYKPGIACLKLASQSHVVANLNSSYPRAAIKYR